MNPARTFLVHVLALSLAGCTETRSPVAPGDGPGTPVSPQFSITVFDLIRLGTTEVRAVNDLGQIVGTNQISGMNHAYRWENGSIIDLGTLGSDPSIAQDVNPGGDVVGVSATAAGSHAFLWRNGVMEDLGTLGGPASDARGINAAGQIVGESHPPGTLNPHAFLWEIGVMSDLGTMGGTSASADAINDLGQIVGSAQLSSGGDRAFLWENGAQHALGALLENNDSRAHDINNLGQVVGSYRNASGNHRAYLWEDGVVTDLGTLGGASSQALGINDLGQIVGSSVTGAGNLHAFLWENGVMYDLGTAGESHSEGLDINNHGDVVGHVFGTSPNEAVRWTVPIAAMIGIEPSPIWVAKGPPSVEVTVYSGPWFDATRIDPATASLGNDDGNETPVAQKKKGDPKATYRDVDRDGDTDLILEFDREALISNGDLSAATTRLVLLGRRLDGKHIRGTADVVVQ